MISDLTEFLNVTAESKHRKPFGRVPQVVP
jgi:hypothetical protein